MARYAILLYDNLARVLRWSLCVCAGLCQLSRRITAEWWRPWKCERSLRPPWGCTAGAQHAQTKTKCPYRPFTTKNGWDLSHRTEISPGGTLKQIYIQQLWSDDLIVFYLFIFILPVCRQVYTLFLKCVLLSRPDSIGPSWLNNMFFYFLFRS